MYAIRVIKAVATILVMAVVAGTVFMVSASSAGASTNDVVARAEHAALSKGMAYGSTVPISSDKLIHVVNNGVALSNGSGGSIGIGFQGLAVVHALSYEGAVRILNVIQTRSSSQTSVYALELPKGAYLKQNANGSVSILLNRMVLGSIRAPWAIDAGGKSVRTSYIVKGNVLIQRVIPSARTSYPVVADPAIYLHRGWFTASWYISRYWTARIAKALASKANASTAAIAGAFAVACAPIGGVGAVVCGAIGAVYGGFAIDQFLAARQRKACIRVRVVNAPPYTSVVGIYVDNSKYCKAV